MLSIKKIIFKFLKKIIHPIINEYILANYDLLIKEIHDNQLNNLRKNTNYEISDTFTIGLGTIFQISGNPKILKVGNNVLTRNYCNFLLYDNAILLIGDNVFFNNQCSINSLYRINIGENTIFGEGVKIYDHNHLIERSGNDVCVARDEFVKKAVNIGKNCWIGSNVTILQGVEIGDNVVIGANNLIYKSIPSNTIVKAIIQTSLTN